LARKVQYLLIMVMRETDDFFFTKFEVEKKIFFSFQEIKGKTKKRRGLNGFEKKMTRNETR
jgi:hypothetical protein